MSVSGIAERSLTERVAQYWARVEFDDLPPEVVTTAKRFLLDTVAAGIAAARTDVVESAVAASVAMTEGATGSACMWGRSETLPPAQAALVNGTACHVLELDDYGGCGHSGAVVVPAVCALSHHERTSGRAALTAIIAGYDLAARALDGAGGYRPHTLRGWHSTGTCGAFGSAAAAARMLGLEAKEFAAALGIAGTFTGGIWAFLVDGSMTKRLHCGKAAEAGVAAAFLARSGMTGPRFILEAEWGGFFSTYCGSDAQPAATLAGLGETFGVMRAGMKPYPCCRDLHYAIDGLLAIMLETGASSSQIAAMRVHGNEQTVRQFSRRDVRTLLDAQFSFPYSLAVAALSGGAGLSQFVPLRMSDPAVLRLMDLVEIVPDRRLAVGEYPFVEISFTDGRQVARDIRYAKGAPENPLSDKELKEKAEELIVPILGRARCSEIVASIAGLEHISDMREFTDLLCLPDVGAGLS